MRRRNEVLKTATTTKPNATAPTLFYFLYVMFGQCKMDYGGEGDERPILFELNSITDSKSTCPSPPTIHQPQPDRRLLNHARPIPTPPPHNATQAEAVVARRCLPQTRAQQASAENKRRSPPATPPPRSRPHFTCNWWWQPEHI